MTSIVRAGQSREPRPESDGPARRTSTLESFGRGRDKTAEHRRQGFGLAKQGVEVCVHTGPPAGPGLGDLVVGRGADADVGLVVGAQEHPEKAARR